MKKLFLSAFMLAGLAFGAQAQEISKMQSDYVWVTTTALVERFLIKKIVN